MLFPLSCATTGLGGVAVTTFALSPRVWRALPHKGDGLGWEIGKWRRCVGLLNRAAPVNFHGPVLTLYRLLSTSSLGKLHITFTFIILQKIVIILDLLSNIICVHRSCLRDIQPQLINSKKNQRQIRSIKAISSNEASASHIRGYQYRIVKQKNLPKNSYIRFHISM